MPKKQKPAASSLPENRPRTQEEWNVIRERDKIKDEEITQLRAVVNALSNGPMKTCYHIEQVKDSNGRVYVTTESGDDAVTLVADPDILPDLTLGTKVLVNQSIIIEACPVMSVRGDIAIFERNVGGKKIEVSYEGRRIVVWAAEELGKQINDGIVKPGRQLIIKAGPGIAFEAIPEPDGLTRFKFLVQEPVPDVIVERDIGAPPRCIEEICRFILTELTKPELHRRYGIRAMLMWLLEGVSGSGKTLVCQAIWRRMYEIMEEFTGVPMQELPPRVFKMRSSQVLSKWLGESDQNLDRFFDEVEQLAKTPFKVGNKEFKLPVLVIMEEIDGLAAQRGRDHDGVYDRILTTALRRLDATTMPNLPISVVGTTNEPGSVDRAMLRRIGGNIEHFGMLTLDAFPLVLEKHIAKVPVQDGTGQSQKALRTQLTKELTDLFYHADQPPVVELLIDGKEVPKYRRDFLTPALIDRAVQHAAKHAVRLELEGKADGVSSKMLGSAMVMQVGSIVNQLNAGNAHRYVTIPEGQKVARVTRIEATKSATTKETNEKV